MNLRPLANRSLLVVAVVYGVLMALVSVAGVFGIWMGLLVLLSLWRYCFAVLGHVAQGREEIPPPDIESMNPVGEFSFVGHFLVFGGSTGWLFGLRAAEVLPAAGLWLLIGLLLVAAPASAALMGITRNFWYSLNPVNVAGLIRVFGRDYVVLLLATLGLVAASLLTQRLLQQQSSLLMLLLAEIVRVWTLPATFALIGSSIRERRELIAIPNELETQQERRERYRREDRLRERETTLNRAYGSIRSGKVEQGYQMLRELVAAEDNSLDVYQWLFDNALAWEDKAHAVQIGRRFIARLIEDGDAYIALEIFDRCRRASRGFAIPPGDSAALARYARSIGRHGLADRILEPHPSIR